MNPIIITIALVAVGIGIGGTIFVTKPDFLDPILPTFPEVSVNNIINEEIDISPGRIKSYEIYTGDSKAVRLIVVPHNPDAKLAVSLYYPAGQNKTFAGTERLNYIVDFDNPLNIELTPEQDSSVFVDLQPFTHSNLDIKISLRHVR